MVLFPVRYEDNIVFHDSVFSSVFGDALPPPSRVAYIYCYHVIRLLNVDQVGWVDGSPG